VRARCYRSMRKNEEPHRLSVHFKPNKDPIISAFQCSCAAGQGLCQHLVGLLYTLSHYQMIGMKSVPPIISKTSKPQVRNVQQFCIQLTHFIIKFYMFSCSQTTVAQFVNLLFAYLNLNYNLDVCSFSKILFLQ